jgi:hypothetical protein
MSTLEEIRRILGTPLVYPTGSRYTCFPPVLDTDDDYIALVEELQKEYTVLESLGWDDCYKDKSQEAAQKYAEEKEYGVLWHAFRKGITNVMITSDLHWYLASVAATELCKAQNIKDKEHRIRIFRNLKYNEPITIDDMPKY